MLQKPNRKTPLPPCSMPRTAEAEPANAEQIDDVAEDAFERDENGDGDEDEEDDEDVDVTDEQESNERSANVAMTTTTTTTTESVEEVVRGKSRLCTLYFLHLFHSHVSLQTFKLYVVQEIPRVMSYMRHLVFYLPVRTCLSGVLGSG